MIDMNLTNEGDFGKKERMRNMYDNSGEKLMGLATVLCTIMMILGGLLAIVTLFLNVQAGHFLLGLFEAALVFGINALVGWVLNLTLYAFGEITNNTALIASLLREGSVSTSAPSASASKITELARKEREARAKSEPKSVADGAVTCPFCKRVFPAGTVFCGNCRAQIGTK